MTKSDSIDRESFLMMAHGLEQMADMRTPSFQIRVMTLNRPS